jgi:predicted Zn-dependent peptidase
LSGFGDNSYVRQTLSGGLEVVLETIPHVRSVSIGVWVGAGSRWESAELAGVSHAVEHLLFKGSSTRTARQIAEEIDSIGGLLNGYTSKEYSCYYVKVLDEHLDKALELLSDLVVFPRFDPLDLDKEKGVILEEIDMYEDTPDELAGDLLAEAVWSQDALGRAVLGAEATVSRFTVDIMSAYHRAGYRQGSTVLALAGNVSPSRGIDLSRRYFESMPEAGIRPKPNAPRPGTGFRSRTKPVEQAHVCLGFAGLSMGDPAIFDLNLLIGVLGGGSSSRLFQTIREDRGLAYSVYAYSSPFSDTGLLGVYAAASPGKMAQVLRLAGAEMARLGREGPVPEELQRAKDQVKASLLLGLENTSNRMSRLGRSLLLLGRVMGLDEVTRRIEAVTIEGMRELAAKTFHPSQAALATVGPKSLPGEAKLRSALQEGWSQ